MGIDFGRVRMGIALSDTLKFLATGYENYNRVGVNKDIQHLKKIIDEKNVSLVVFGLPLNMDGTESETCVLMRKFAEELKNQLNIQIDFMDERLTSLQAEDILIEANYSRQKRKGVLDQLSAEIILQTYLDAK